MEHGNVDHLALALAVDYSYTHKTGSVGELEYLLVQGREHTSILLRGTEISHRDAPNFKEKVQDTWDLIRDFRIFPWRDRKLKKWGHAGFLRGARGLATVLSEDLPKDKELILCGHSLGGAIAVALAFMLKKNGYKIREVVTFGAPKVFFRRQIVNFETCMYQNSGDWVTKVPFGKHPVKLRKIGKGHLKLKGHPIQEYTKSLSEANADKSA